MWHQKSSSQLTGLVSHLAYIVSVTIIVVVALVCLVANGRGIRIAGQTPPASLRAVLNNFSGPQVIRRTFTAHDQCPQTLKSLLREVINVSKLWLLTSFFIAVFLISTICRNSEACFEHTKRCRTRHHHRNLLLKDGKRRSSKHRVVLTVIVTIIKSWPNPPFRAQPSTSYKRRSNSRAAYVTSLPPSIS
jgi:hypothetical protein